MGLVARSLSATRGQVLSTLSEAWKRYLPCRQTVDPGSSFRTDSLEAGHPILLKLVILSMGVIAELHPPVGCRGLVVRPINRPTHSRSQR